MTQNADYAENADFADPMRRRLRKQIRRSVRPERPWTHEPQNETANRSRYPSTRSLVRERNAHEHTKASYDPATRPHEQCYEFWRIEDQVRLVILTEDSQLAKKFIDTPSFNNVFLIVNDV